MSPKKRFFCVMGVPLSQLVNAALQPDAIQHDTCVDPTAHTAPHRQCFWLHVYNPPSKVTSTDSFIRDMPQRFNFTGCGGPGITMSPKKQFFCVMEVPLSQLVNAALQPDGIQLDACVDPTAHTAPHRQCFWLHVYDPPSHVTSTFSFIRDMPHRFNFTGCGGPGMTMSPKKQFFCVMGGSAVPVSERSPSTRCNSTRYMRGSNSTHCTASSVLLASRLQPAVKSEFYRLIYKGHAASLQLHWVWRTRHHDVAKKQFFCVMEVPLSQLVNAALQPDGIQLDACVDPTAHTAPHRQCFWLHVYDPPSHVTSTFSFIREMPHSFNFSGCGGPGITMSPKKRFFCVMGGSAVPVSERSPSTRCNSTRYMRGSNSTHCTASSVLLASRLQPAVKSDFYRLIYKGHAASLQLHWVWRTRHNDVA
ncbi:hypothetical protein MTO96_000542 [Rhipicephalus appendiculatus]